MERRLRLMRLEQRRVLNADFTFAAAMGLSLTHVDGDLSVREVSGHIEFDLSGSVWHDTGSSGLHVDNSVANHSILSVAKADLHALSTGMSIVGADSTHQLTFDTQATSLDLHLVSGSLAIQDFGEVRQVGSNTLDVNDLSVTASTRIELQHLSGDDITLSASEIDFTGGAHSVSGTTLSILSNSAPSMELGGGTDHASLLDFTDTDIAALNGHFQSITFGTHSEHATSDITVHSSGADFSNALAPATVHGELPGSLYLDAASVHIDGELTSAGGLIDVSATSDVTVSHSGGLVNHGGSVHLDAGESGTLLVAGQVDVSGLGTDGIGGTIHLLGDHVGIFDHAAIDASGSAGGGTILIGGDFHGANPNIHNASATFIGSEASIAANATHNGNGGQIAVWSDEVTQVYGSLTARGGSLSGDGGFIETSSHGQLLLSRGGDASAVNGNAGTWLLDPLNVGIVHQLTLFPVIIEFNELPDFTPSVVGSEVTDDAIESQLQTGTDVVITTENLDFPEAGNVTQAPDATIDVNFIAAGDSATLTIHAANDIVLNGGITATNGALNVVLNANAITNNDDTDLSSGNVEINESIDLNGGSFESTGVDFNSTGFVITASGGVTITQTGIVDLGKINTGTGTGGTLLLSGATAHEIISVGEGNVSINGANDDLVIMADVTATASVILSATRDVIVQSTITLDSPTSDLIITADSDSDGAGGFWLDESSATADAQLIASHDITIIGSSLVATAATNDDIRIDGDGLNPQVIAGHDLTLLSNFDAASTAGDIVINGIQKAVSGSLTVFSNNLIFLGAEQTAGTDVLFKSGVQLTNDVAVSAGDDVTFDSTVDDDGDDLTGSALTVTTELPGGNVLFVGAIGAIGANAGDRLDSLTVDGTGFVDFLDTVAIDGDITVTNRSTVDFVTFQNAVTTTAGLAAGSVTITNSGLLITSPIATFNIAGSFTQNGTGSTELGADITTVDGDVSFAQAVLLTESVKIDTSNGNRNITFSSTIDSEVVPLALLDGNLVPVSQVGGDIADVVAVIPEHNSLELAAGSGVIRFDGDIGAGFIDVGVGSDGDQTLGMLVVDSARSILIGPVMTIHIDGAINIGRDSVIADGIHIAGVGDPNATTIQSDHGDIRINGVTTSEVDLNLLAAGSVTLTDDGSIFTNNNHNLTIVADTDGDSVGDFVMGAPTEINVGAGFIDVQAAEVFLGKLTSASENSTGAENPAIRVNATFRSITDINGDELNLIANQRTNPDESGAGVVLEAVLGIGSGNALETDIASLAAFNHDLDIAPTDGVIDTPAQGNIEIRDIGTTSGRVDLIFVHNQANPTATGDTINGVIDIFVESGDLRVVDDGSRPLLFELLQPPDAVPPPVDPAEPPINPNDPPFGDNDQVIAAIQSENTIRLTANTIEIFDDMMAIQDSAPVDNGINELIQITARDNFTLAADRVITTDENYVGSLLSGDPTQAENVGGAPASEFPEKPRVTLDQIQIIVGLDNAAAGNVFLGLDSTISTDAGVEQQIAHRPAPGLSGTAFYDFTSISASDLQTNGLDQGGTKFLGFLTVTIGLPGEKNLIFDIDWGDTPRATFNALQSQKLTDILFDSNVNPATASGSAFRFDQNVDRFKTRFFIPEGGLTYIIPHEYSSSALNLPASPLNREPGRNTPSDPFQLRFSVSQHTSISILGRAVHDPTDGPADAAPLAPVVPSAPGTSGAPLAILTSTDVIENEVTDDHGLNYNIENNFRLNSGIAEFNIPTSKAAVFFVRVETEAPPIEAPRPVFRETVTVSPSQLTTEVVVSTTSSSTVITEEYFELRKFDLDGTGFETERLNDFRGEGLLEKERFEEFIRDKGDGEYEIWFITKENSSGATIERPVIRFRLESGRLAPPPNESTNTFKPFRLVPVDAPAAPMPKDDANNDANDDADDDANLDGKQSGTSFDTPRKDGDGRSSVLESQQDSALSDVDEESAHDRTHRVDGATESEESLAPISYSETQAMTIGGSQLASEPRMVMANGDDSSVSSAAVAAGVLVFAGTWNRIRRRPANMNSPQFSKAARLTRKLEGCPRTP